MQIKDRVAVVTGGASGIGRALCRRFAAEGAKGVVVADLDGAGAEAVAREIGGLAVATDVAREADIKRLVERATAAHGPIDLFCSNAGIGAGAGLGDGEEHALAILRAYCFAVVTDLCNDAAPAHCAVRRRQSKHEAVVPALRPGR